MRTSRRWRRIRAGVSPDLGLVRPSADNRFPLLEVTMKYALLIYEKPGSLDGVGEDEYKAIYAEYMALSEDSRCIGGAQLQPIQTATTVRVQNGSALTTD